MNNPKLRDLINIKSGTIILPSNILMIPIELQSALRDILPAVARDYRAGHFSLTILLPGLKWPGNQC